MRPAVWAMDYAKAKQLFEALERERVQYLVFGAVALNFHGLPRFTEDLDLFICAGTGQCRAAEARAPLGFRRPSHRRDHRGRSPRRVSGDPVFSSRADVPC